MLLPSEKMNSVSSRGIPFEREFHEFLLQNFGGYTQFSGNVTGCWKQDGGGKECIEHCEYQVACRKPSQRRLLEGRLAELAVELDEESIFYAIAGDVYLIEPVQKREPQN